MPHDFSSHVLRRYFEATGWNEANSYLHLTSSSAALLDFTIPPGVSLSFSASPAPTFFNTYRLRALPSLRGSFGYIFASIDPERLAVDGSAGSPARPQLDIGNSSARVRFKDVIDRFKINEMPRRPVGRQAVWQAGRRVDSRDYLLYGCIHVPSGRLDALYSTRLGETWQLLVTAVSSPPRLSSAASTLADLPNQHQQQQQHHPQTSQYPPQPYGQPQVHAGQPYGQHHHPQSSPSANASSPAVAPDSGASSHGSGSVGPPGSTNLQFTLQHDTGRWCTEYSYSADDALWGFRVLHNFGWPGAASAQVAQHQQRSDQPALDSVTVEDDALRAGLKMGAVGSPAEEQSAVGLVDPISPQDGGASGLKGQSSDDLTVGGGLRGRFSAGAELFFSAVEKSAGLSTGIRFMTLPDAPTSAGEGEVMSQPPTILTATLNPMLGHLSTAYAAKMSRNAVVGSRFDFNVYSYESEFTIGAEYWLRSQASSSSSSSSTTSSSNPSNAEPEPEQELRLERREPVLVAPPTTASLRDTPPVAATSSSSSKIESPVKVEASLRPQPTEGEPTSFPSLPSETDSSLSSTPLPPPSIPPQQTAPPDSITGVLKFRFSSSADVALLWEGRLRNCLVNLGVRADLTSRSAPIKSVGLDVLYFGTAGGGDGSAPTARVAAAAAAAAAAAGAAAGARAGAGVPGLSVD
ncbi:unnamed protein product [Tilletia controversa]|uniref:Mitochondrial distribution and morphology protein 10 n=1 Tax=Tilletia controversa TaxID=13291 RepID=A0A8X7SW19_9BASI|nr:hypothetical protein CF328_g4190 [Tilletia controversa]KAE8246695.1 hypothetical protein A4X06_0g4912 [Tilletia controversa]CAD6918306.1 unnamed protein product [Tilletia controversa]CAD6929129.1 unnamed protein product [Tilletia controversa]CAD6941286.1 unnamed protein product [Tilletia controversa]